MKKDKKKEINYWIGFEGLLGFSRIDHIEKSEWEHPTMSTILFPIHQVMSASFVGEGEFPSESTTIKLVFEFRDRLETGLIYRFRGYEK